MIHLVLDHPRVEQIQIRSGLFAKLSLLFKTLIAFDFLKVSCEFWRKVGDGDFRLGFKRVGGFLGGPVEFLRIVFVTDSRRNLRVTCSSTRS